MLDIRIPIGLLFTILGAILLIFGVLTMGDEQMYRKSLEININLVSGTILLVFGVIMLLAVKLSKKKH
jgi:uncharacterized membrane protein HdeD (DUF308 family)